MAMATTTQGDIAAKAGVQTKPPLWTNLGFQVAVSMVLGIGVGLIWPDFAASLKILGDIFLRLIKTAVAPLVFLTVAAGIAAAGDIKRVGKVGLIAMIYFEIVSTIALTLGLVFGNLIGAGKKKHAAQEDIWKDLRSLAYFGICDCQYQTKQYDSAIIACQKSLSYYHQDPYAHYDLALAYLHKAQIADSPADLGPALEHFRQVLNINPDLDQAKYAKQNITMIQKALGQ